MLRCKTWRISVYVEQLLNNILDVLIAIASLSLIAGVIIIANAVALAMLERRRELGILKSVGYTSGTVLSEVMIENGIVGAVGALMAMLLATGAIVLLGNVFFNLAFSVSPLIVIGLIGGSACSRCSPPPSSPGVRCASARWKCYATSKPLEMD